MEEKQKRKRLPRGINENFQRIMASAEKKVKLIMKIKGYGDVGVYKFDTSSYHYLPVLDNDKKAEFNSIAREVAPIWFGAIKEFIDNHTEYIAYLAQFKDIQMHNRWGSPIFQQVDFFILPKSFEIPKDEFNLDISKIGNYFTCSSVKFKYSNTEFDFSKPAISAVSCQKRSIGIVNLKNVKRLMTYLIGNTESNMDTFKTNYNANKDTTTARLNNDMFGCAQLIEDIPNIAFRWNYYTKEVSVFRILPKYAQIATITVILKWKLNESGLATTYVPEYPMVLFAFMDTFNYKTLEQVASALEDINKKLDDLYKVAIKYEEKTNDNDE